MRPGADPGRDLTIRNVVFAVLGAAVTVDVATAWALRRRHEPGRGGMDGG